VYDLLPIHTHHFYPGPVTMYVGEPILTKGMTVRQTEELTARLKAAIADMLERRAELDGTELSKEAEDSGVRG
jgi:1-acyl-sn-glycerol-3-phosphate acyltransferase